MLTYDSGWGDSGWWGPNGPVSGAALPMAVGAGLTLLIMAAGMRRREDEE